MNKMTEMISKLKPRTPDVINIVQITDTHILDDGAPSFNDFDTSSSLTRVVNKIRESESSADLVLLTGDLVHEPTKISYQKLADHLSVLTIPVLCLPGNHDAPELMRYVMGANGYDTGNLIQVGDWFVILLNTCLADAHNGELSEEEILFLKEALAASSGAHCLIALHHHPVPINSSWMDAMSLNNAAAFLDIVGGFEHVRGIIWGHIHQEFEQKVGEVMLFGSPSTCLQFKPVSDEFVVDNKGPAYRRLCLNKDGSIDSKVVYLVK